MLELCDFFVRASRRTLRMWAVVPIYFWPSFGRRYLFTVSINMIMLIKCWPRWFVWKIYFSVTTFQNHFQHHPHILLYYENQFFEYWLFWWFWLFLPFIAITCQKYFKINKDYQNAKKIIFKLRHHIKVSEMILKNWNTILFKKVSEHVIIKY